MNRAERSKDAFGQAMWAHFKGRGSCLIFERDDGYFWAGGRPEVFFSGYRDWRSFEKKAIKFVKGRVLDVGCGVGRHSLYLQGKGFDVFGVDNSSLAIEICRLRGLKKTEVMAIESLDFKPNSFDTIIMLGNNFGLMGNPEKAVVLLKSFSKITSATARIIAASYDPYITDEPAQLEYQKENREKGRMSGQTKFRVRFEKAVTDWMDWLIVSKEEMEDLLANAGWKISKVIESKDPQYVAIIEKE